MQPTIRLAVALLALSSTSLAAPIVDDDAVPAAQVPEVGLGRDFHAGRRAALREVVDGGWILLRGLPATRDYVAFRQDKVFWYFTGIESPGASLLMDAAGETEILYLPDARPQVEQWEGPRWDTGDEWARAAAGVTDVRPERALLKDLEQLAAEGELTLHVPRDPWVTLAGATDRAWPYNREIERDPLDGRPSRERALAQALEERFGAKVENCSAQIAELRRIKTPEEVAALRRAADASVAAILEAVRSTRAGLYEWEIDALMTFVHRLQGGTGPAYYAIVGAGANSCVLHYSEVSKRLEPGEVLLVDYACELDHQTCDITRTWPVDASFSPRAAELYDIVAEAQVAGIAASVPGASFGDVDAACNAVFERHGVLDLRLHGPSHYIGMEVHDPGSYAKRLEPGVAITVEPGLYDTAAGIGIRIEDVILVTDEGPVNLTAGAPRARAEIEALRAQEGLLDRMQAGE
ncbi:M24 family metallopeptidase [Engelhardtia mirabilis]|uniref:Xaa-Pro aminopeptidase n=1 Tax=Engelhardtia mirabilis TaxID=2528011 RepID=A0A518BSQ2_9BACT|nr:Xaa-Pro aminopeptidase [Planctomycetes bacterium Pla133]QDV04310.1 Xaa-Pro aminopeptidase [Planctomycetes bacterium Pla86]